MKTIQILTFSLIISLTTTSIWATTCTGDASCNACKNCKYCKHCSQEGGSCGVCTGKNLESSKSEKKADEPVANTKAH